MRATRRPRLRRPPPCPGLPCGSEVGRLLRKLVGSDVEHVGRAIVEPIAEDGVDDMRWKFVAVEPLGGALVEVDEPVWRALHDGELS